MHRQHLDRILLVIDIQEAASRSRDPAGYVAALDRFVRVLLERSKENAPLLAFKFFDSSLPPCSSDERVSRVMGNVGQGLRFRAAGESLRPLGHAMQRLVENRQMVSGGSSNAEYVLKALQETLTDFSWDSSENGDHGTTMPNLVLVLSTIPEGHGEFSRFLETAVASNNERKERELPKVKAKGKMRSEHMSEMQSGVMLLTETPNTELELKDSFCEVFQFLRRRFQEKKIHLCWVQGPQNVECEFVRKVLDRMKWGCTELDTFVMASLALPRDLLVATITSPPLTVGKGGELRGGIKLAVRGKDPGTLEYCPAVCSLSMVPLASTNVVKDPMVECESFFRMNVVMVLPRRLLVPSALTGTPAYLVWRHASRKNKIVTAENALFQRLKPQGYPDRLVTNDTSLPWLLAGFTELDGVGLVNVELDGSGKYVRGILEPYNIHCAIFHCIEDFRGILQISDCLNGVRDVMSAPTTSELRKKPVFDLKLETTWDEAWTLALRHLKSHEVKVEIPSTERLRYWMKQVKQRLGPSLLEEIGQWIEGEPSTVCRARAEEVEAELGLSVSMPCESPPESGGARESEMNRLQGPSFSESEATLYISSLKERLSNCLNCSEVDVQRHAKNVVEDTIAAAKVLSIQSVRELILECPSKLSLKYRRSEDSSAQKVQEFVLQIKLRLELLAAQLPDFEVETRNEFIEDIASLMEEVQFSLPGDIFDDKEGLLEFTNRIVKSGYEKVIPDEVQQIYRVMELSGFDQMDIVLPPIAKRTPNSAGPTKTPITMERSYFAGKQQRLRVTVRPKARLRSRLNGRGPESDPSMCEFVPDTPMQLDTPAQGQRPSAAVSDHERPLKKRLRYTT